MNRVTKEYEDAFYALTEKERRKKCLKVIKQYFKGKDIQCRWVGEGNDVWNTYNAVYVDKSSRLLDLSGDSWETYEWRVKPVI